MVENQVIVITGAARGIGFEIGKRFAENGGKIVLSDIDQTAVEAAAQNLREAGFEARCQSGCNKEEIKHLIETANAHFGAVHTFINNAGLQHVSPIEEFPTEKYELMIKIMLTAPFMAIKHAFPIMKNKGSDVLLTFLLSMV